MTLEINFAQYLRNGIIFQGLTRFYQNGQYRALFWQPCLKVGVQEGLYFWDHDLFQKWKCLHLKKNAFLTFLDSGAGLYPRVAVAMKTVYQGIKSKLMEMFFLKYDHDFLWFICGIY